MEFKSQGTIMVIWCKEGTVPENVVFAEMPTSDSDDGIVGLLRSHVPSLQLDKCQPMWCYKEQYGKAVKKCKCGFPCELQGTKCLSKSLFTLQPGDNVTLGYSHEYAKYNYH